MKRKRSHDSTDQPLDDFGLVELLNNRMVSQIDNELLESLKNVLSGLDNRQEIVTFASQFITEVTKHVCDDPLILTLETKQRNTISMPSHPTETIRGQTSQILNWSPFTNDEYLVLKSKRGDLMSVLGIDTKNDNNSPLEISSDTPARQMRRKYNTILRSVAIIIGCAEKSGVRSAPVNWISAYALLSKYYTTNSYCQIFRGSGSTTHEEKNDPPMPPKEALSYAKDNIKDIDEIDVPPLQENFDIATEILFKTTVECYNTDPLEQR